jgi:hypothetical protein
MGGLFIGIHDHGATDNPRRHPALSPAPSGTVEDALAW